VDTKQVIFYDTIQEIDEPAPGDPFYGQDANYSGFEPEYADNGDGTVSDLVRDADPTTGSNEIELNEDSIKLYPNPANGNIKAEFSSGLSGTTTAQVLSLMGEIDLT
jgi:hypothetical protein